MSKPFPLKPSSLIVLAVIAGFVILVWQNLKKQPDIVLEQVVASEPQTMLTTYAQQSSIELPFEPEALALHDTTLFVSSDTALYAYTLRGGHLKTIVTGGYIMDVRVSGGKIYVLHPESVAVYDLTLNLAGGWEACDDHSMYGQLAVAGGKVYVTDSNNKLVWRFSAEGVMEGQIISPSGFIVPGYQFAVTVANDTLYCANPGLHKIERYTLDGKFIDSHGSRGTEEGSFAGCCNPCGIVITENGDLFTAEKGISRVSAFSKKGIYQGTLLSNRQLDNDNHAPLISGAGNRLAVAHKNTIQVFRISL